MSVDEAWLSERPELVWLCEIVQPELAGIDWQGDDGERTLEVDVEVVGAPQTPLDIAWTTRPVEMPSRRQATAGSDYLFSEGTVPPTLGSENRPIEIDVLGDTRPEGVTSGSSWSSPRRTPPSLTASLCSGSSTTTVSA